MLLLLCETWRSKQAEIWETHQGRAYMGAGRCENKHGVGILLKKKWGERIKWTEYINGRAIATSITVNKQLVLLMSVYFPHSGCADHHVKKAYRAIKQHEIQ